MCRGAFPWCNAQQAQLLTGSPSGNSSRREAELTKVEPTVDRELVELAKRRAHDRRAVVDRQRAFLTVADRSQGVPVTVADSRIVVDEIAFAGAEIETKH